MTDENKIPSVNYLVTKTDFNTEVIEIEGKIRNVSVLATKTELTTVENKIPSVSNLAKESKINEIVRKINEHEHGQYITT